MAGTYALRGLIPNLHIEGFTTGNAAHGFFGRRGGVSEGVYTSLNCGQGSDDSQAIVAENRSQVARALGIIPENLLSLYQVHGSECHSVEKLWDTENRPKADAMITDRPGIGLGILSADCVPVLFNGGKAVAAAHAGWKGALGGVLESTISAFAGYGVSPHALQACIGPCIGQKSYEVDVNFVQVFLKHDENNERFFREARRGGHFQFDLPGYCASRLQACGVKQIFMSDLDTYTRVDDFFSYRRSTHKSEPDYGRQISVISLL